LSSKIYRLCERNFSYDPFGRLKQVNETGKSQGFDHDGNGNRIAQAYRLATSDVAEA
jgi:YD repeat-containing protein